MGDDAAELTRALAWLVVCLRRGACGYLAGLARNGAGLKEGVVMIILGLILLILGAVFSMPVLWTIGIILIVVGAVLWILGSAGRQIGPRAHYW
jgi:hypothetical protein